MNNTAIALSYMPEIQVKESPNMENLLESFYNYIDVKEITAKSYETALKCFFQWLSDNEIKAPQRADIKRYTNYLATPHKAQQRADRKPTDDIITMSAGTQARYLRAVKLFFKWTASEGLYPNVADNVKGAKVQNNIHKRDAFEHDDAKHLLESIDRSTLSGKRDYAMILICIVCGLRIIEIQRADVKDIEMKAGEHVIYIQGKGHDEKDAYKKIPEGLHEAIMDYLNTRGSSSKHEPLFTVSSNRAKGERLTEPGIAKLIKDRMKAAGYDTHRLSAHSLRHTSVTFLLESGATLQEAQQHARHANIDTTLIYAHNIEQEKAHPEQRIYNYLFEDQQDTAAELLGIYDNLPADKKEQLLAIARAMKG